jgi:DNA-binding HxlR family transcriptional regulator
VDGYGQFCPVSLAAEVIARRWTPLIVRELLSGSTRFNELRRGMPSISASMLSRRLAELEAAGIVVRGSDEAYRLTEAGEELRPVVEQLGVWGRRWLPTEYREEDLDPRLLVWDIHRNIRLDEVPERTVVELYFPDASVKHRGYWLVIARDGADVCLSHPGGEIDVRMVVGVRTLTDIWMGNTTWARALQERALRVTGDAERCTELPGWLRLSPFAQIPPAAGAARAAGQR